MLSDQSIRKYQKIYRRQFGVELSREQAAEQAVRLLNVARVIFALMPKAWLGRYNELLAQKNRAAAVKTGQPKTDAKRKRNIKK
jgi:hypothetical protein